MFSAMFSSQFNKEPDEDGEYFIDRNPKHFELILEALRQVPTVSERISKMDSLEKEEFKHEVEYYQIPSLLEKVAPKKAIDQIPAFIPDFSGANVSLQGKKFTKIGGGNGFNATALCTKSTKWAIKILNGGDNSMIGLAPKTFQKDTSIYNNCGWYLYLINGTLYSQSGDGGRSYYSGGDLKNVGTIIGVEWNQTTGTVSFFKNGQNLGIAYS